MRAVEPAWLKACSGDNSVMGAGLLERVDHLVYAAPELEAAVDALEGRLGVRAAAGGRHPSEGTRNFLMALGPASYLEIVGPDAEAPAPSRPRWFGIDTLTAPRLVAWAARAGDLEEAVAQAAAAGVTLGRVSEGSRETAEGQRLSWRFTDPRVVVEGGVVPFLIDWGQTPHPALSAPRGAILEGLRAEHPEPERAGQGRSAALGLDLPVEPERTVSRALIATIRTPRREKCVELRIVARRARARAPPRTAPRAGDVTCRP